MQATKNSKIRNASFDGVLYTIEKLKGQNIMQPTMIEMLAEERLRELDKKRQLSHHAREFKSSRRPYHKFLARLLKHAE